MRWVRCAYPPYGKWSDVCAVGALRLPTLREMGRRLLVGALCLPPWGNTSLCVVGRVSAAHPPSPLTRHDSPATLTSPTFTPRHPAQVSRWLRADPLKRT
ncbi:hypothetical protein AUM47_14135 [Cronobacter malonaticus]|nr:hypothetical protein [Cronobacter malonaticus]